MFVFEFDEQKSQSNFLKHGIGFVEAQALWNDENLLEIPARVEGEPRYLVVARWAGRHWSAIVTYRGHKIRLISVRCARNQEVELYENSGF